MTMFGMDEFGINTHILNNETNDCYYCLEGDVFYKNGDSTVITDSMEQFVAQATAFEEGCIHNCDKAKGSTNIVGCTDATATNYNPDATDDDGTCQYTCDKPNSNTNADGSCASGCITGYEEDSNGDCVLKSSGNGNGNGETGNGNGESNITTYLIIGGLALTALVMFSRVK